MGAALIGFFLPELLRFRGKCLLRLAAPDLDAAVLAFESATATSRRQNARAFQLRAATNLAPCRYSRTVAQLRTDSMRPRAGLAVSGFSRQTGSKPSARVRCRLDRR
jgi:hypothetical protein